MKSFQQNLLVVLALSLCALCVYQWYAQTLQRNQIDDLNRLVNQKAAAIQDYTNSIATMTSQIAQMDGHLTEFKATIKTNEQMLVAQRRDLNRLEAAGESLTNEIVQYKEAVDKLEAKLKETYEGVKKQNEAMTNLVAQRDEFVKKYNDEVADRNAIVAKYNELAEQVRKINAGSK